MWTMSASLPRDRVERLLSYSGFREIVDLVGESASILDFAWEPFQADRLSGCHRASFLLQVSPPAYDAFFNSPAGYRGQFARNPDDGEIANRALLTRLEGTLLEFGLGRGVVPPDLLKKSLSAADAKVWIHEREVENHLGDDTPEILHAPWLKATSDGVGPRAPLGRNLEVKGGWLDLQGNERRDPYKASRSADIHTFGFS
jgi:hypothetical protein